MGLFDLFKKTKLELSPEQAIRSLIDDLPNIINHMGYLKNAFIF